MSDGETGLKIPGSKLLHDGRIFTNQGKPCVPEQKIVDGHIAVFPSNNSVQWKEHKLCEHEREKLLVLSVYIFLSICYKS